MLAVSIFHCGSLMLSASTLCEEALHVSPGRQLTPDPGHTDTENPDSLQSAQAETTSTPTKTLRVPHAAPCFVDDILVLWREALGADGEVRNDSLAAFGICRASDNPAFVELIKKNGRDQRNDLRVFYPAGVLLSDEEGKGVFMLTFDPPQSPLLQLNTVLLLGFENPLKAPDLDITFTSQCLHPNTQTVCVSGETQYILLTTKPSEGNDQQTWRISVATTSADMRERLKQVLIGGESGNNISLNLLLLSSRGTDTSPPQVPPPSPHSSFLCQLRRFLSDILPRPDSPPINLDSLHSLPPLTIGPSSSESLLAGLMNSSAPTVFSFSGGPNMLQGHRGELALPPALLEELKQMLEQTVTHAMEVIKEEDEGDRVLRRLERLKGLCAFPKTEPAAGLVQYRAFLLLKALQTVVRAFHVQRSLRDTRADLNRSARGPVCSLRSLTVSLERDLIGPNTAIINNCKGSCAFPMISSNNHAVLLNFHIESGNANERAPCCVPIAYNHLEVVDLTESGSTLVMKPDMVATECGCR